MFLNEESQRIVKNALAEVLRKDVMQKSERYCSIGLSLLGAFYANARYRIECLLKISIWECGEDVATGNESLVIQNAVRTNALFIGFVREAFMRKYLGTHDFKRVARNLAFGD